MNIDLKDIGYPHGILPGELWRYVANTNSRYLISNTGRLLTTGYKGSKLISIMKPAGDAYGYQRTSILLNKKITPIKIHRLVAAAFVPNPENKPEVNHLNFDPTDNRVENLEWVTRAENMKHSGDSKRRVWAGFVPPAQIGEANVTAILTVAQVLEIRAKFKPRKYTRDMLAAEYGVKACTIKDVILRRSWRHVK